MNAVARPLIVLTGPTATGKSSLALKIAKKHNGEVINADSRQVYKEIKIGTAKPDFDSEFSENSYCVDGITHHLYNCIDPKQLYSLADYQKDAFNVIDEVLEKGKLPILCGGTGLYIDAVVFNYELTNEQQSLLRSSYQKMTVLELQTLLLKKDPEQFNSLNESDRKNPHRLIRRIEKIDFNTAPQSKRKPKYDYLYLVLFQGKDSILKKIEQRTKAMLNNGLVEENIQLRKKGLSTRHSSMKTIGYQEFDEYFMGNRTLEEVEQLIIIHTNQYAKRQLTWFRRNKEAVWVKTPQEAFTQIKSFLTQCTNKSVPAVTPKTA